MVEACNASFQVHLQLAEPERFAHFYNVAQLLLAPVLAVGTNSPVLFGRRLWAETRIALFEQACDIRTPGLHLRDAAGRVCFGREWMQGGVVDLYKENIDPLPRARRDRQLDEDALEALARARSPSSGAAPPQRHDLPVEPRRATASPRTASPTCASSSAILPSGPTVADEVANGAFWLGLMSELGSRGHPVAARFDHAQANLYAAAREGLSARFTWLDGEECSRSRSSSTSCCPRASGPRSRRRRP